MKTFVGTLVFLFFLIDTFAIPFSGRCADIWPNKKVFLVRQTCLFEPGGVQDIPMLIFKEGFNKFTYFESWFYAPPALGFSFGCQRGVVSFTNVNYSQSVSCATLLQQNQMFSSLNHSYVPQPDQTGVINVRPDGQSLTLMGAGVSCEFSFVTGPACLALCDVFAKNISSGVPYQPLPFDPVAVCLPY